MRGVLNPDGTINGFRAFSEAGKRLAELHLGYEDVEPHELEYEWATGAGLDWRVEKMRLSRDKRSIRYNDALTLHGVPAEAFGYRLGNRSALEWVIDQYRVKEDSRSGIVHDPNAYSDDPQYVVDLIRKVITVSLETVRVVEGLARLPYTEE